MSADVAHPLIVPAPRLLPPVGAVLRQVVLGRLRSMWRGGRLEIVLPSGEIARLGADDAPAIRARVHDDRLWLRMMLRGEMGAAESYVAGEWSSDDLPGVLRLFLRATEARGFESPLTRLAQLPALARHRRAANTPAGSARNVHAHYDLGNAFYGLFLDAETMAYSCAIYDTPGVSLADAQRAKLERMCALLELSPRHHLLEIGCGWGGLAIHAASTRGCKVTAITVSREQHDLARARVHAAGLADRVDVQLRDYRDLRGTYDHIASVEMLEAVGYEYMPGFFATCLRALAPGGRLALQTITMPDDRFDDYRTQVDWMQTYIFPGACIPSLAAIRGAAAGFRIADARDIGPDYAPTLREWRARFVAELPAVRRLGFDDAFIRTWLLYLAFSEASFAEGTLGDHQLLLAPV